jgi:hypothetical protein
MRKLVFGIIAMLPTVLLQAQTRTEITQAPYFTYSKGLGIISPDSLFLLNIRFRMQNRAAFTTVSGDDLTIDEVEARVRRLRLRFDGFIYTPRLAYLIQLSFTRADMDYESLGFPNIVRDAFVQYAVTNSFSVGIGQTKLPGNRQRVTSSGDLQLADRSIVNSTFNIDRDFGIQLYFKKPRYFLRGAISSGEGRNISTSDNGLAYTARGEFLPFGQFTNGGDYFEGDLAREPKPKVSLGLTYSFNQNAIRTGGQLGTFLYTPTDMSTTSIDFLFKHNGWSFSSEFMRRASPNPITVNPDDGDIKYVYVGHGQNYQGSYLFRKNYEIVVRYSVVKPDREIQDFEQMKSQYTLGGSKYIRGHRLKLQSDITYEEDEFLPTEDKSNFWIYRFQIEIGI